ncbi:MAG: hypothetical protein A2Y57_00400 [Candidatus Woykebacteria bacterium RBG_13_40_7b]|uniref:Uncharacterized protein n=1 Tax=Candidatus Woykebacteria bacterium RBG_13_40_7b TaxID=1802594 RepID=A0A1G1WAH5_9BACT|nr:MAG: hypothetical protein A2Y57_00400 [Candidatus Woykebacteria bacterium RBG_13_40_7b]
MSALKLAISYSLPSYQLGFCGPQEEKSKKVLLDFVNGKKVDEDLVKEALTKFEAPYPYFKLIAKSNGIADPFDERVVKAMWVGNELLDKVKTEDLRNLIRTEFAKPGLLSREEAEKRAKKVPASTRPRPLRLSEASSSGRGGPDGAVPHHSFHVLILGPVTGRVNLEGAMLDLCRIGWGRVTELRIKNKELIIRYRPLVIGKKIRFGEEVEKGIGWNKEIVPKVKIGDWVSFHWGQACEVLTPKEVQKLEHYTQGTINLVNAPSR